MHLVNRKHVAAVAERLRRDESMAEEEEEDDEDA